MGSEHEAETGETPESEAMALEARPLGVLRLSAFALLTGAVAGVGAVIFRALIGLIHNLLFLGQASTAYDAEHFTPVDTWGPWVILVPVIGALGVTWLVQTFAPEARGHGVPEVMDATYYNRGIIRPVVAVVKSLASALAIGSGAAVGREGPIIQIGAAMGSTLGQVVRMTAGQRITLVAAGAGAGIAATFNTPLGGVLFASELLLPEVSVTTFLPVAVATGAATFIGRLYFGSQPAFAVPSNLTPIADAPSSLFTLLLYLILGVLAGVVAAAYIRGLHRCEDLFEKIGNGYLRHGFGMFLVGLAIYALAQTTGHFYIEGVGYSTIQAVLNEKNQTVLLLAVLLLGKLFAACVSLGSGSSGGIFSPSLFMGATLGAAFAGVVLMADPSAPITVPAFAMVGMGALVGGGTGAVVTAVTMTFEMTRDYDIVFPMILAVAAALTVRQRLVPESIYTMKLARRGHPIPKAMHSNLFLVKRAGELMDASVMVMDRATTFAELIRATAGRDGLQHVVITAEGQIIGTLRVNTSLRRAVGADAAEVTLGELAQRDFVIVPEAESMFEIIGRMPGGQLRTAVVVRRTLGQAQPEVLGVISRDQIAKAVADGVQIYPG
ncbi:chloride channel protein [Solirhodobacter olei]|uniref:chloride channel protein n=1 Tax=Solirhodobacter olei TaxID=2493082 RepID=UPI001F4E0F29|nr:chloride channel protein [Solirhodobacter olei]